MKKLVFVLVLFLLVLSCKDQNIKNESLEQEDEPTQEEIMKEELVFDEDLDNPMLPARVTYFGRASMRIDFADDTVVYIDPYAGDDEDYNKEADLVLVTHQHGDHNQVHKVRLKDTGEVISCPIDIKEGDVVEAFGLKITAVAAYNSNHEREKSCGFIIETGKTVIYHSGDTSYVKEMKAFSEYKIDYAFITMDGYWNMGHKEAKLVADTILAEVNIPMHTDGNDMWNQSVAEAFDHERKLIIKPGETLEIK